MCRKNGKRYGFVEFEIYSNLSRFSTSSVPYRNVSKTFHFDTRIHPEVRGFTNLFSICACSPVRFGTIQSYGRSGKPALENKLSAGQALVTLSDQACFRSDATQQRALCSLATVEDLDSNCRTTGQKHS